MATGGRIVTKLYDLTADYSILADRLEQAEEPDDLDALRLELDAVRDTIASKAESICGLIQEYDYLSAAAKAEKDRLAKRQAWAEKKADWLRSYLQECMKAADLDRIRGDVFTITTPFCPPSVRVIDEGLVPPAFKRTIPATTEVDKRGILDHVKQYGEIPPGVEYINDRKRLSIR